MQQVKANLNQGWTHVKTYLGEEAVSSPVFFMCTFLVLTLDLIHNFHWAQLIPSAFAITSMSNQ